MKENVNTLAIEWEHKYRVLQGKYNSETRDLRQALMHRDASNRSLRVELSRLGARAKVGETNSAYWKGHSLRLGIAAGGAVIAALALLLLAQSKDRDIKRMLENCTLTTQDPAFMELPPTRIEGYPAQPTVEL